MTNCKGTLLNGTVDVVFMKSSICRAMAYFPVGTLLRLPTVNEQDNSFNIRDEIWFPQTESHSSGPAAKRQRKSSPSASVTGMLVSDVKQDWNKTKVELIDDTGEWFIDPVSIR